VEFVHKIARITEKKIEVWLNVSFRAIDISIHGNDNTDRVVFHENYNIDQAVFDICEKSCK